MRGISRTVMLTGPSLSAWYPSLVADGAGGVIAATLYFSPPGARIVRLAPDATLDPAWPAGGVSFEFPQAAYVSPIVSDGAGGAPTPGRRTR